MQQIQGVDGMAIKSVMIGSVKTLKLHKPWHCRPDDRQQMIEVVGSVEIQDYGHVEDGDVFEQEYTVTAADWPTILDYWNNRTKVTVINENGELFDNLRIKITGYDYIENFKGPVKFQCEFWRK
jgi:hypothetical protein